MSLRKKVKEKQYGNKENKKVSLTGKQYEDKENKTKMVIS